jgi:hypothetical protein
MTQVFVSAPDGYIGLDHVAKVQDYGWSHDDRKVWQARLYGADGGHLGTCDAAASIILDEIIVQIIPAPPGHRIIRCYRGKGDEQDLFESVPLLAFGLSATGEVHPLGPELAIMEPYEQAITDPGDDRLICVGPVGETYESFYAWREEMARLKAEARKVIPE